MSSLTCKDCKAAQSTSVRVLPGALPEIQERPLSEIPSLVREHIPTPAESGGQTHDVFISHASEDKDEFVRPLANALIQHGLNVWFDEMTLKSRIVCVKKLIRTCQQ